MHKDWKDVYKSVKRWKRNEEQFTELEEAFLSGETEVKALAMQIWLLVEANNKRSAVNKIHSVAKPESIGLVISFLRPIRSAKVIKKLCEHIEEQYIATEIHIESSFSGGFMREVVELKHVLPNQDPVRPQKRMFSINWGLFLLVIIEDELEGG